MPVLIAFLQGLTACNSSSHMEDAQKVFGKVAGMGR